MISRREFAAGIAGSVAAIPSTLASLPETGTVYHGTSVIGYGDALKSLSAYARAELDFWGLPGMVVTLVDATGFTAVLTFGHADVERRLPLTSGHLLQLGSISKSVTAAVLLSFVDEGRLELDAPLARYLPDLPLPPEPITVRQALSHTAGLPAEAPVFPRVPRGRLWCGVVPGTRFSYSNTGYDLLGHLLARLSGGPHPTVLKHRLLDALGMNNSTSRISDHDRPRYAVGYAPTVASRPFLPRQPLVPAPWINLDAASCGIASTADEVAAYLRFLLCCGRGEGGAILSSSAGKQLAAPLIKAELFGPGARYGLGLATVRVGHGTCLHHTGGMPGFSASFHADAAAGVACFVGTNAQLGYSYRPRLVSAYAVELMRAARSGDTPSVPDMRQAIRVGQGAALVGRYAAADGPVVELRRNGGELAALSRGVQGRVIAWGDTLATDHPDLCDAPFQVERRAGQPVALWWGAHLLFRDGQGQQPAVPDRLRNLTGRYDSGDPWVSGVTIRAHGERLVFDGGTGLYERGGYWSPDSDDTIERLRFEAPAEGRPSRLSYSGVDLQRRLE